MLSFLLAAQALQPSTMTPASPAAPPVPAVRARADLSGIIGLSDYPGAVQRAGLEGSVRFELEVGPNGRVRGCRVLNSSGVPMLDEITCELMTERPRFTPARNAAGEAVPDRVRASVTWQLPDAPPAVRARPVQPLAHYIFSDDYPTDAMFDGEQGTVTFELDISAEGRAVNCHILGSSGHRRLDLRACQAMLIRARFEPARDAQGRAVPDVHGPSRITWRAQ
jgi:TonB family protein